MNIKNTLQFYADKYEKEEFLKDDPSWFMHQVEGSSNQEIFAFIASCLSYGSRKQFFPKIQFIIDKSDGDVLNWIRNGSFEEDIPDNENCYYRLYNNHIMNQFLHALKDLIEEYGTLREYIKKNANDGYTAVTAITNYFNKKGIQTIIPKDTSSACKRVCMYLRWMVRDHSEVDLGLWKDLIDKRTLIMPLDTHVLQESCKLGLLKSKTTSMGAAKKLSAMMLDIFPTDPLKEILHYSDMGLTINYST